MKTRIHLPLLAIVSMFACSLAYATLIGDTVIVSLQSPLGTSSFSTSMVGQTGTGDQTSLGVPHFIADIEGSMFCVSNTSLVSSVSFSNTGVFNGLVVSGIDETITGFSIVTNLVGWDNSRLTFDANSFSADFRGLSFLPGVETMTTEGLVDLEYAIWCATPVKSPDAGSSAALLAVGLLGLGVISRRLKHCRV